MVRAMCPAGLPYPGAPRQRLVGDELPEGDDIGSAAHALPQAIEAARRGEADGWDVLFERFHPDVHAYALARLGEWTAAEDVTQETFVAAVRSIRSLRDDREPAVQAWFLHICRHKVVDHLRRRQRDDRALALTPAPPADPAHVAEGNARAAEMRTAMEELTEDQRDVLVRRFVLDQSLEDVASATSRSVGAVKSLQHRALGTLQRILARRSVA